jgi:hypothetical protein
MEQRRVQVSGKEREKGNEVGQNGAEWETGVRG